MAEEDVLDRSERDSGFLEVADDLHAAAGVDQQGVVWTRLDRDTGVAAVDVRGGAGADEDDSGETLNHERVPGGRVTLSDTSGAHRNAGNVTLSAYARTVGGSREVSADAPESPRSTSRSGSPPTK